MPSQTLLGSTTGTAGSDRSPEGAVTAASLSADINRDYYDWILQQANRLRGNRPVFLDWENLAEELDAMARSEERAIESQLERVLLHLLKWRYQPARRSGSWQASIENGRDEISQHLKKSPSLGPRIGEMIDSAYRRARRTAGAQMGLDKQKWEDRLPEVCPWTPEQIQLDDFWPEPDSLLKPKL